MPRHATRFGIDVIEIAEDRRNRTVQTVEIETIDAGALRRISDRGVVLLQPVHELHHLPVSPHPGREPIEGLLGMWLDGRASYVAIQALRLRPIRLERDDRKTLALDERLRDSRAHEVELGRAVRCLAEADDARIADAFEERVEVNAGDVVEPLRMARDERRQVRCGQSRLHSRCDAVRGPALLADERHERDGPEVFLLPCVLAGAPHTQQVLYAWRGAHRNDEPTTDCQLILEWGRHARPAGGDHNGIEGGVLR